MEHPDTYSTPPRREPPNRTLRCVLFLALVGVLVITALMVLLPGWAS